MLCCNYDSSVLSTEPFAFSSLSNQLTLPTLLRIQLHKFTKYTEMKPWGFGLCCLREEITLQPQSPSCLEREGTQSREEIAGERGCSLTNALGQRTPALLPREKISPTSPTTSLLILAKFGSTQQKRSSGILLKEGYFKAGTALWCHLPGSNTEHPCQFKGGESLTPDMQGYASFSRAGGHSLENGSQSSALRAADSNYARPNKAKLLPRAFWPPQRCEGGSISNPAGHFASLLAGSAGPWQRNGPRMTNESRFKRKHSRYGNGGETPSALLHEDHRSSHTQSFTDPKGVRSPTPATPRCEF